MTFNSKSSNLSPLEGKYSYSALAIPVPLSKPVSPATSSTPSSSSVSKTSTRRTFGGFTFVLRDESSEEEANRIGLKSNHHHTQRSSAPASRPTSDAGSDSSSHESSNSETSLLRPRQPPIVVLSLPTHRKKKRLKRKFMMPSKKTHPARDANQEAQLPTSPESPKTTFANSSQSSLLCPTANCAGVFLPRMDVSPMTFSAPTDSLVSPIQDYCNPLPPVTPVNTDEFLGIINEVRLAIAQGTYPTRISQGSSGSYFCRDRQGSIVGVFKPKNEEPYGHLNPKWTKWIHRNLFPWCFGRSCLIPNLGYVSEAAASYLDRRLGLNLVPRTEVVELASPTFYYSSRDRRAAKNGITPLPPKLGSFQLFLNGYVDATKFFQDGYSRIQAGFEVGEHPLGWDERMQKEFRWGFERLVVLDYLIRNTDRGMDNWMVKQDVETKGSRDGETNALVEGSAGSDTMGEAELRICPINPSSEQSREATFSGDLTELESALKTKLKTGPKTERVIIAGPPSSLVISSRCFSRHSLPSPLNPLPPSTNTRSGVLAPKPTISVAAIDSGLAFPYKHPDRWRSYPYGWASLPIARVPISTETQNLVLPLLTSNDWWLQTFEVLETLFRLDEGFDESMWKKQKAVIRGQGYNLVEVLGRGSHPSRKVTPRPRGHIGTTPSPVPSSTSTTNLTSNSVAGDDGTPLSLVQRPVVCVFEDEDDDYDESGDDDDAWDRVSVKSGIKSIRRTARRVKQRFERMARAPRFSWC